MRRCGDCAQLQVCGGAWSCAQVWGHATINGELQPIAGSCALLRRVMRRCVDPHSIVGSYALLRGVVRMCGDLQPVGGPTTINGQLCAGALSDLQPSAGTCGHERALVRRCVEFCAGAGTCCPKRGHASISGRL